MSILDVYPFGQCPIKTNKNLIEKSYKPARYTVIMFKIFTTDEFDKDFDKLDSSLQKQIEKEIEQLEENPYVGKPLSYKFFREKRIKNYRIYYLIYEEYVVVFVIALSDKKGQQNVIDSIKHLIPFYKEEIKKKIS